MPYNEKLASRIREALAHRKDVEEKEMFRGLTFMVDGKMFLGVSGENLMVRFDPERQEEVAEKNGFQEMKMKGRIYKGYGYIHPEAIRSKKDFDYWVQLALDFNPKAKSSKKRSKK